MIDTEVVANPRPAFSATKRRTNCVPTSLINNVMYLCIMYIDIYVGIVIPIILYLRLVAENAGRG